MRDDSGCLFMMISKTLAGTPALEGDEEADDDGSATDDSEGIGGSFGGGGNDCEDIVRQKEL
jgi:hypothetical protein